MAHLPVLHAAIEAIGHLSETNATLSEANAVLLETNRVAIESNKRLLELLDNASVALIALTHGVVMVEDVVFAKNVLLDVQESYPVIFSKNTYVC